MLLAYRFWQRFNPTHQGGHQPAPKECLAFPFNHPRCLRPGFRLQKVTYGASWHRMRFRSTDMESGNLVRCFLRQTLPQKRREEIVVAVAGLVTGSRSTRLRTFGNHEEQVAAK